MSMSPPAMETPCTSDVASATASPVFPMVPSAELATPWALTKPDDSAEVPLPPMVRERRRRRAGIGVRVGFHGRRPVVVAVGVGSLGVVGGRVDGPVPDVGKGDGVARRAAVLLEVGTDEQVQLAPASGHDRSRPQSRMRWPCRWARRRTSRSSTRHRLRASGWPEREGSVVRSRCSCRHPWPRACNPRASWLALPWTCRRIPTSPGRRPGCPTAGRFRPRREGRP